MTTLEDSTELRGTNTLSSGLANTGKFSAYDALENLRCEGQDLAAYLSQLLDFPIHTQQRKIILRAQEKLSSLLSNWEEAYEFLAQELESLSQKVFFTQHSNLKSLYEEQRIAYKDQEISLLSKLERKKAKWITREEMLQKEIEQIRVHLEEGQDVFLQQMNSIQESVKKQELARQRIESKYILHLGEVDKELDEILHMHKKGALKENYGVAILPQLFTPEELEEENRLALGEQSRRIIKDVKMPRINVPDDEKVDINPESDEPSYGSMPDLDGTRKVIYDKLRDLRNKVYSFRHEELTTDSTDNELTISLPSELRSLSQTEENIVPVLQNISQKITRGKTVLILNQNTRRHGNSSFILGVAGIVFGAKNEQEFKSEITKLIKDSKQLSLEEQEGLVYSLLNECLPNGQDARLDDILSISKIDNSGIEASDHKSGYIFAQEFSSIENSKDHSNFVQDFSGYNSQHQILEQKGIATIKCESPIQGNLILSSGRNDSFEDFFDKSKEGSIDLDCSKFLKSKRSEETSDFLELSRIEEVNSPKAEFKCKFNIPKLNLNLLRTSYNEPGFILAPEKASQKDDKKSNTTLKKIESPKRFQIEKREPILSANNESSFIIAPEQNSSFFNSSFFELAPKIEDERGRPREKTSKPPSRKESRVLLKAELPEESISLLKRPKLGQYEEENSISCLPPIHLSPDESVSMISNASSKISSSSSKKLDTKIMKSLQTPSNKKIDNKVIPISIQKKLPIIPVKPPPEAPKQFIRNVRGRSLQPINPSQLSTPHSPMSYNKAVPSESVSISINLDTRSESPPTLANRFRIRRFKEVTRPALKSGNFSFFTPKKPVIAKH